MFRRNCGACSGKGYYGLVPKDTCKICTGVGVITFEGAQSEYRACGTCSGTGYYTFTPKNTCKVCGGYGLIHLEKAPVAGRKAKADEPTSFWEYIHPNIRIISKKRFEDGHFADSVEAAFKEVNSKLKEKVKQLTGEELDGADLMYKAFSPKKPIFRLDASSSKSSESIQNGFMQIFAGSMTGIRNPKAHENISIDEQRGMHFIFLASLLMFKIDEAIVVNP
jgi:uncharacterized protein (TIGR02391 family)